MKRLLVIALILLTVNTVYSQRYNQDGSLVVDIDWYVDNIKSQRYEITDANQLAGLAALVNGTSGSFSAYDFTGKVIVLASDIDMGAYVDEKGFCHAAPWVPIGLNYSTRFAGTFDGRGYCIKNLAIKGLQTGSLFGYNSGAIRNLVISGGMVCSEYYGAGICSHNSGEIDHCINTASIYSNNYGGGICGKNYDGGRITNCINLGYVHKSNICGGIVGSNAVMGTDIVNCVYDAQMCPLKRGCGNIDVKTIKGLSTAQIVLGMGYDSRAGFVLGGGMYPRLQSSDTSECIYATHTPVVLPDGQNVESITKAFVLTQVPGVEYQVSDTALMGFDGKLCSPRARACVSIQIKGGGCVRYVNVRITNETLPSIGSDNNPVRIKTYDDLVEFANAVNNCTSYKGFACMDGFRGVTFVQMDNIQIPRNVNWQPIGSVNNPFNGTFVGYGYVISNINIMRPLQKYCGLFGYNTGVIRKVVMVGGQVIGSDYTGSICGYNSGLVEKSVSTIPVRGHYYAGGICGFMNSGQMKQCIYLNAVEGLPEYTGGILGGALDGEMSYCVYDRQLYPASTPVGQIDGTRLMQVSAQNTADMVGEKLKSSAKDGFAYDFIYQDGLYPRVTSTDYHAQAIVGAIPVMVGKNENVRNLISFVDLPEVEGIRYSCNQAEVLRVSVDKAIPLKQGAVIFSITDGTVSKIITMRIVNKHLESVGSEDNPLVISNYRDLDRFRNAVNLGTDYKGFACINGFEGVHFQLRNNIVCPTGTNQEPIGNTMFPFKGVLDGNMKMVSHFSAQYDNRDNVGFVGYNMGVVKRLRVSRSPIKGRYYSGGICGYNAGTIMECFHDSASVYGTNYAGGICGYHSGTIAKCTNNGAVKCDYYAGGICGSNVGVVDTCVNQGVISGTSCVGGITGSNNARVSFCFNTAGVNGIDNTGGISGRNAFSQVLVCDNKGMVNGGDCTGGIVGLNDGTVSLSTNSGVVSGLISVGGISGKGGKVTYSSNSGRVRATGNYVGGIMGSSKANSEIMYNSNSGNVFSQAFAGGICADNVGGKIKSCISLGDVEASYNVGGVCGQNSGTIYSSISTGSVQGNSHIGGVCGRQNDNAVVERCFYNKDAASVGGIEGSDVFTKAIGISSEMLKSTAMAKQFTDDDFDFVEGQYPKPRLPMPENNADGASGD